MLFLAALLIAGGAYAASFYFDDRRGLARIIDEDPEGFKVWKENIFGPEKNYLKPPA